MKHFETEVYKSLYWIPIFSVESKKDVKANLKIEGKSINTLLDFVDSLGEKNIFEITEYDDYKKIIKYNGYKIEYQLKAEEVVKLRKGVCTDIAVYANYFFANLFNESGYILHYRDNGVGGHVVNYFNSNDYCYIIDVNAYVPQYKSFIPNEDGNPLSLIKSKVRQGILLKTKNIENYVEYRNRLLYFAGQNQVCILFKSYEFPPVAIKITDKIYIRLTRNINYMVFKYNKNMFNVDVMPYNPMAFLSDNEKKTYGVV